MRKLFEAVPSVNNGITFCASSYGSSPDNDLFEIIDVAKERIHFVHARNMKWTGELSFQEVSHSVHDDSLDMVSIIDKLVASGVDVPIRPDHGRMIWGETGRPGYGLYDRALAATYLNGILDTLKK